MLTTEEHDAVLLVRLEHGKVNALDLEMLDALGSRIEEYAAGPWRALVLAGSGRVFSAGVDLVRLLEEDVSYTTRLLDKLAEVFEGLYSVGKPTIAAVNGAAIAGGCVLVTACDRRIVATSAKLGVTEISVGVPFPVSALEIVRAACGAATSDLVLSGRLVSDVDALRVGLAHELVDPAELEARALSAAEEMASLAPEPYRLIKAQVQRPTLERIAVDKPVVDAAVVPLWSSSEVRDAVRASLERTTGKSRQ